MAGTDLKTRKLIAEGPAIILVEPQLGENIGMVARAMANFGLAELRLVNPRDGWPNPDAVKASAGAVHVVEGARVFETPGEAVGDLHYVAATTARARDMIKPVHGPLEAAINLRARFTRGEATGILFGRERWGLNNDEIALADAIVTFPVNPAFASLNIAQAVLLVAYEWMKSGLSADAPAEAADRAPSDSARGELALARRSELLGLADHLEAALEESGYFHPPARRERMAQILRNILTNMKLDKQEVQTLRGVVAALEGRHKKRRI